MGLLHLGLLLELEAETELEFEPTDLGLEAIELDISASNFHRFSSLLPRRPQKVD